MEVTLRVEHKHFVEVLVDVVNVYLEGRGLFGNEGGQVAVLAPFNRHIDLLGL